MAVRRVVSYFYDDSDPGLVGVLPVVRNFVAQTQHIADTGDLTQLKRHIRCTNGALGIVSIVGDMVTVKVKWPDVDLTSSDEVMGDMTIPGLFSGVAVSKYQLDYPGTPVVTPSFHPTDECAAYYNLTASKLEAPFGSDLYCRPQARPHELTGLARETVQYMNGIYPDNYEERVPLRLTPAPFRSLGTIKPKTWLRKHRRDWFDNAVVLKDSRGALWSAVVTPTSLTAYRLTMLPGSSSVSFKEWLASKPHAHAAERFDGLFDTSAPRGANPDTARVNKGLGNYVHLEHAGVPSGYSFEDEYEEAFGYHPAFSYGGRRGSVILYPSPGSGNTARILRDIEYVISAEPQRAPVRGNVDALMTLVGPHAAYPEIFDALYYAAVHATKAEYDDMLSAAKAAGDVVENVIAVIETFSGQASAAATINDRVDAGGRITLYASYAPDRPNHVISYPSKDGVWGASYTYNGFERCTSSQTASPGGGISENEQIDYQPFPERHGPMFSQPCYYLRKWSEPGSPPPQISATMVVTMMSYGGQLQVIRNRTVGSGGMNTRSETLTYAKPSVEEYSAGVSHRCTSYDKEVYFRIDGLTEILPSVSTERSERNRQQCTTVIYEQTPTPDLRDDVLNWSLVNDQNGPAYVAAQAAAQAGTWANEETSWSQSVSGGGMFGPSWSDPLVRRNGLTVGTMEWRHFTHFACSALGTSGAYAYADDRETYMSRVWHVPGTPFAATFLAREMPVFIGVV